MSGFARGLSSDLRSACLLPAAGCRLPVAALNHPKNSRKNLSPRSLLGASDSRSSSRPEAPETGAAVLEKNFKKVIPGGCADTDTPPIRSREGLSGKRRRVERMVFFASCKGRLVTGPSGAASPHAKRRGSGEAFARVTAQVERSKCEAWAAWRIRAGASPSVHHDRFQASTRSRGHHALLRKAGTSRLAESDRSAPVKRTARAPEGCPKNNRSAAFQRPRTLVFYLAQPTPVPGAGRLRWSTVVGGRLREVGVANDKQKSAGRRSRWLFRAGRLARGRSVQHPRCHPRAGPEDPLGNKHDPQVLNSSAAAAVTAPTAGANRDMGPRDKPEDDTGEGDGPRVARSGLPAKAGIEERESERARKSAGRLARGRSVQHPRCHPRAGPEDPLGNKHDPQVLNSSAAAAVTAPPAGANRDMGPRDKPEDDTGEGDGPRVARSGLPAKAGIEERESERARKSAGRLARGRSVQHPRCHPRAGPEDPLGNKHDPQVLNSSAAAAVTAPPAGANRDMGPRDKPEDDTGEGDGPRVARSGLPAKAGIEERESERARKSAGRRSRSPVALPRQPAGSPECESAGARKREHKNSGARFERAPAS